MFLVFHQKIRYQYRFGRRLLSPTEKTEDSLWMAAIQFTKVIVDGSCDSINKARKSYLMLTWMNTMPAWESQRHSKRMLGIYTSYPYFIIIGLYFITVEIHSSGIHDW